MPSRVIRGGFNSSESMAIRSRDAELLFLKLILAVDDYGRTDARIPVLLGLLWPLRDDVSRDDLEAWLSELTSGEDAPVFVYEVGGKPFLQLVNWEEHRGKSRRGSKSRWPDPLDATEGFPGDPRGSVDSAGIRPGSRGVGESGKRGVGVAGKKQSPPPPAECVELAEQLRDSILTVKPNCKIPKDLNPWARTYDQAIRLDKRTPHELADQTSWLFGPNQSAEARFEVFSAEAHRKKFDAIERAMQRGTRAAKSRPPVVTPGVSNQWKN